jgi:hypothetical protein
VSDSAKARYTTLKLLREPFLKRARDCSALTIPTLIPPEGFNHTSTLVEPNQGLGARLVVNLASRVMNALLPSGRNYLILGVSPEALLSAGENAVPEDLQIAMSLTERLIQQETERRNWRQPTFISLQHLIVAGNILEYLQPDNSIRNYRLDQYVVVRDPSGQEIEIIVEEALDPVSLTGQLREIYESTNNTIELAAGTKRVCLYTWLRLIDGEWQVHQELEEQPVPGTEGTYSVELCPYVPLRWSIVTGESYGRSKVEEHLPDLRALDELQRAMLEGAAMASRNITMIRPNAAAGVNLRRNLAKAKNGDYVVGNPEDVLMLQFQNNAGLQITQMELNVLRQELGAAFLLAQSMTRQAERVTATEIRMMAQELEGIVGGVYPMLSQDMMARRTRRLIFQMQVNGQLPEWPEGTIEPTILTGLEALGRESQVGFVAQALQMMQGYPESAQDYVKWDILLKKGFNGLNLADAVRTEAEAEAVRQQRMEQMMAQQAMAQAAGPIANAASQAMIPQS